MKIPTIYVIAGIHGEELFGLKIIAALQHANHPNVITRIAHPEAIAKRRRFIETDLNRSFGIKSGPTKESIIAEYIMADIEHYKPDIIIDIHTSHGKVGKVAITATSSSTIKLIASKLGMEQIVVMPNKIAKAALIGQYPQKALSIEFGTSLRSDNLAHDIAERIIALAIGSPQPVADQLPVYYVQRLIKNYEAPGETLYNYRFSKALNGYPFLVGKNTYNEYRGFLAIKLLANKRHT